MAEKARRAGWYPDPGSAPDPAGGPTSVGGERWWNGASWSDTRRDANAPQAVAEVGDTASVGAVPVPKTPPVIYSADNPAPQAPGMFPGAAPRTALVINAKNNPMAMYGFIAGLFAFFFNILLIPSVFAIVFGIRGFVRANQLAAAGETNTLKIFAVLGIVLGVLGGIGGLFQIGLFVISVVPYWVFA